MVDNTQSHPIIKRNHEKILGNSSSVFVYEDVLYWRTGVQRSRGDLTIYRYERINRRAATTQLFFKSCASYEWHSTPGLRWQKFKPFS